MELEQMELINDALSTLWTASDTPIFKVLTDGVQMGDAVARKIESSICPGSDIWIYSDSVGGYCLVSDENIKTWNLVEQEAQQ